MNSEAPDGSIATELRTLTDALLADGYVAARSLVVSLLIAERLHAPLLLEGPPGVGKTAAAKALASIRGARLIRLQCYEGLSAHHALYEWDYARQLITIRLAESVGAAADTVAPTIFDPRYLLRRPLLEAIWPTDDPRPVVLLIDEVDRADEEFEAMLLELLAEYQITIPEIGTVKATREPTIVLTANRTRALSDALRRRCIYHWIPLPGIDQEIEIIQRRVPGANERLVRQVAMFVHKLRTPAYRKQPGISEGIDWMRALTSLGVKSLTHEAVTDTLGCLLKDPEDIETFISGDGSRVLTELGVAVDPTDASSQ